MADTNRNPSVNRYLNDKRFDHIDHALGRPVDPMGKTYRNYFGTQVYSRDFLDFDASEFWELGGVRRDMAYFHVTDLGRHALRNHLESTTVNMGKPWRSYVVSFDGFSDTLPARSRGEARYRYFLRVRDALSSLTFRQFLIRSSVRAAA